MECRRRQVRIFGLGRILDVRCRMWSGSGRVPLSAGRYPATVVMASSRPMAPQGPQTQTDRLDFSLEKNDNFGVSGAALERYLRHPPPLQRFEKAAPGSLLQAVGPRPLQPPSSGTPPKSQTPTGKKCGGLTAKDRKRLSEMMKKRWGKRPGLRLMSSGRSLLPNRTSRVGRHNAYARCSARRPPGSRLRSCRVRA